jgi:hypothetical protein
VGLSVCRGRDRRRRRRKRNRMHNVPLSQFGNWKKVVECER